MSVHLSIRPYPRPFYTGRSTIRRDREKRRLEGAGIRVSEQSSMTARSSPPQVIIQSWHERAAAYHHLIASWPIFSCLADRLIDLLPQPFQGSAIDLAAGSGLVTKRLLDRYPHAHVQLVEPAAAMLALARKQLGTRVASYSQLPAEEVGTLTTRADVVLCSAALHLLDEAKVFTGLACCLPPGGLFVCNLWWHSWEPTVGPDYTSVWQPLVEQALADLNEPRGAWPQPSPLRVRTEAGIRAAAHAAQLTLETIITDTDTVTNRFFIDFAAMSATFLGHLSDSQRATVIARARERANTPVQVQSTRFVFRRETHSI